MDIIHKFIILIIFIFLIILFLNIKKNRIKSQLTTIQNQTGGQQLNCNLSEIKRHTLIDNKWVYINGKLYDITPIINTSLEDTGPSAAFANIRIKNVNTFLKILKYTDLQDLHILLKSVETFNIFINNANLEDDTLKLDEFDYELSDPTIDTVNKINMEFNKFKVLLLISLEQFKLGIICPGGLTI